MAYMPTGGWNSLYHDTWSSIKASDFQKEKIQVFLEKAVWSNLRIRSQWICLGTKPKLQTLKMWRLEGCKGNPHEFTLILEHQLDSDRCLQNPAGSSLGALLGDLAEMCVSHIRNRKHVPGPSVACSEQMFLLDYVPNKHPSDSVKRLCLIWRLII